MADTPTLPGGYPDGPALSAFLLACGLVDTGEDGFAALDPAGKMHAATEEWEQGVQWLPFLSPGVVQTRLYDPPGPPARRGNGFSSLRGGGTRLFLEAGLLTPLEAGLLTPLEAGLLTPATVSVAGVLYEAGIQYLVRPGNAAARGKPYTWIEFLVPVLARAGDVAVTGVWGYSLACPAQARAAILAKAAALCAPQLAVMISKGQVEKKAGDEMEKYSVAGVTPLSAERRMWEAQFDRAVLDLSRPELF